MHALVGDLISLVTHVKLGHVALFGEFDSLFVGILREAPENYASVAGPAVVEAIAASLHLAVANVEVVLSAERLDGLINQRSGLAGIFLIGGNRRRRHGGGRSGGSRGSGTGAGGLSRSRRRRLRRGWTRRFASLRPGRTHQNQNREKLFHSTRGSDRVQSEL